MRSFDKVYQTVTLNGFDFNVVFDIEVSNWTGISKGVNVSFGKIRVMPKLSVPKWDLITRCRQELAYRKMKKIFAR
jgi:hypothetical protein